MEDGFLEGLKTGKGCELGHMNEERIKDMKEELKDFSVAAKEQLAEMAKNNFKVYLGIMAILGGLVVNLFVSFLR